MSTRLSFADDGTNAAAYSYLANSPLVGQILFQQSGTTRMTTSKQYDYLNRLSSISSTPSDAFAYQYNAANQRTVSQLWDGSYWRYAYDALGQVTSGSKSWVDGTPVAGQQFDYAFDTIGNRTQTEAGGDQSGLNLRVASYTNNSVNEITSRGVPAAVDVLGDGLTTNSVTVNGTAAYRKSAYFREQLSVTNTAGAVWDDVTVAAPGQTSVTGHVYVAQNPETYTYDADGNLLSDGRWTNVWDGENRLVSMTSLAGAPSGSQLQLVFAYDYAGRRIQKMVSTNNGSAYVGEYTNNYVYDGWNLLAEVGTSGSLVRGYLWGADLSGRVHGAGGVGGLVEVTYYGAVTTNCFVAYDGGGNVSALVNAVDGSTLANYDYGPFGEVIRMTGPMAGLNPLRFSTKYEDDESGFFDYGFRYYNPSTGGWLNRDPIAESGGLNLYGFVGNSPVNKVDPFGLVGLSDPGIFASSPGLPVQSPEQTVASIENNPAVVAAAVAPLAVVTGGVAAEGIGVLGWLGLGGVAAADVAQTPTGQEAIQAVESPAGQQAVQAAEGPAAQKVEAVVADASQAASKCKAASLKPLPGRPLPTGNVTRNAIFNLADNSLTVADTPTLHVVMLDQMGMLSADLNQLVGGFAQFVNGEFASFQLGSQAVPGTPEGVAQALAAVATLLKFL